MDYRIDEGTLRDAREAVDRIASVGRAMAEGYPEGDPRRRALEEQVEKDEATLRLLDGVLSSTEEPDEKEEEEPAPLHLMTQRDQPYGSVRMCCERCGKWLRGSDCYTDEPEAYENPPRGFVRCD